MRASQRLRLVLVVVAAVVAASRSACVHAAIPSQTDAKGRANDLGRDARAIFAKHCTTCHGAEKQKSGLRLDRKNEALAGGDSGPAIIPGKSGESDLIARVSSADPETVMPPKGERLRAPEIDTLRRWIDAGAAWTDDANAASSVKPTHWAFQTPTRPAVPQPRNQGWIRNPIDAFVLERVERENVRPSDEADRPTLLRRLSLDLLGLPPSREEVHSFFSDSAPDAYERLVDRLLSSPQFGERWARHWLDLARYADSDGYEKDTGRPHAWRYRDWVINALNRDMPFDQFTMEQLAGDLLPNATIEQKIATGFHRNTLTNKEGGVDQEEFRVAAVVDRVNTTGTVWLGLTVGCAQCHTHKYDPILQKEYYGLFAFFNSEREVDLPAPLPGEREDYEKAKAAFDREHEPFDAAIRRDEAESRPARGADWEKSLALPVSQWQVLIPTELTSKEGATLTKQSDGSILVSGINPDTDTYTIRAHSSLPDITAFRLEALADPALGGKGPGRTPHGNFVLSSFEVTASPADGEEANGTVSLQNATADYAQDQFPPSAAIDSDPATGWAVAAEFGKRHVITFETRDELPNALGTDFTFRIEQRHGSQHTLGRFRLSVSSAAKPVQANIIPDDVAAILVKGRDQRTADEQATVARFHRTIDPTSKRLADAAAEHRKKAPKPPASRAQTLAEEPQPRKTHVLIRGDFLRKGEEARPGVPAFLPALKSEGETPTRLDLARWLTDPANPLTARVAVNRIWRNLFGRPLAVSVEDFGTRGEKPSHPELLDWLACEFSASGWSQKSLIRLIVTSATYRQASHARPELIDRDPNNTWLSHQNRFRPEAEVVRDVALSVSSLLAPRIGGPSVHPPQPPGISELTYANSAKWVESRGADRYRRGLYTWFQRTSPYPMLMTFDAPDSNVCAAKRERSNTPLQALTLLNDAMFVECAQTLGRSTAQSTESGSVASGVDELFARCLARGPTNEERTLLWSLFENLRAGFQADAKAAKLAIGPHHPPGTDPAELAAWIAVARTILNTDEFVTRE
jgi:mono/diheme cytochrome c family protein